jgi:preprotein translocase subunit SecD
VVYVYLKYGLAALAVLLAFAAFAVKSKRGPLVWAAASAAVAGLCSHFQVFWLAAVCALMIPWALVTAGDWIDSAWRSKVGFCVFLAIGAVLCLYPTYIDERFARPDIDPNLTDDQQAEVDAKAKAGELGFGRFVRANIPFRLVRGLDLKGGFRVEYAVDVQEAIKDKRDRYFDDLRTQLARTLGITEDDALPTLEQLAKLAERVKVSKPRDDVTKIAVEFNDDADYQKANNETFLARFTQETNITRGGAGKVLGFQIKGEVVDRVRADAVAQAKEKIHRRIDSLGVKETQIAPGGSGEDIVVEVPGDDRRAFEEIKSIISQTARLEFKMLDDTAGFFDEMANAPPDPKMQEEGIMFRLEDAPLGPGKTEPRAYALLEKRPGEKMVEAKERMRAWVSTLQVPDTHQIVFGKVTEFDPDKNEFTESGWRTYYVQSNADIVGDMIRVAQAARDQADAGGLGGWQVSLEFTPIGADRFEKVTGANINKRFAIILDDVVESAPVIQGKIAGGSARITMGRNNPEQQYQDAKRLELVIKSGALPAPIFHKNEQVIGPQLGADAIQQGIRGALVSGLLVLIAMLIIYSRAGFIANLAVIFNLVLQVAILAMFGASLTLPGIAGLVLTIGIAVDANVLINERIRDELRAGKTPRQAVDTGYDRAFSAIIDGHMTTLISGLILFQYGSGPIKGFAVALIVGMVSSLFTGVVCTRLMFDYAVRWRKVKQLSLG